MVGIEEKGRHMLQLRINLGRVLCKGANELEEIEEDRSRRFLEVEGSIERPGGLCLRFVGLVLCCLCQWT